MTDRSRNNKPASSPTASGSFTYSDFTTRKKKRKNKHQVSRTTPQSLSSSLPPLREKLLGEGEWFANCSRILSDAWKEFRATTTPTGQEISAKSTSDVVSLLCLGLGSPSASLNARVQLAFLTEACKVLDITLESVSIYDPVFTEEDIAYFKTLQMKVLEPSEETNDAHLILNGPTVCFMPHCDMELYDALFGVNVNDKSQDYGKRSDNESSLKNVFLIGNNLEAYLDSKPSSELKAKAPNLLQFAPLLKSYSLPPSHTWPTAFNNTSVQFLPRPRAPDGQVEEVQEHQEGGETTHVYAEGVEEERVDSAVPISPRVEKSLSKEE